MNPFGLTASSLCLWGVVAHLVADWPLQNEWMALNKMKRRVRTDYVGWEGACVVVRTPWWDRHPSAYVHASIHGAFLALVFGWAAVPLAVVHLLIDLRVPVARWSLFMRQTQPSGNGYDIGADVRIWNDQVFHIICIASAALAVSA